MVEIGTPGEPGKAAAVVLSCSDLDSTLSFFIEKLGFRIDVIFPADNPSVVDISGHGLHIRLQRGADGDPTALRIFRNDPAGAGDGARELTAPNGTRIHLVDAPPPLELPPLRASFVLSRMSDDAKWQVGRAGMRYRDLIPDRQGGRFIASHIHIPDGGPVPDYVHFHKIHFQMIYCYKGWVRVVYEDQGSPFVMQAGDCVLQPPQIRHRVLDCSPGLEVIEIGSPAEHETRADHDLTLPTPTVRKERDFNGQRFVRHTASGAKWRDWRLQGFRARDTGIAAATDGIATVHVVCPAGDSLPLVTSHNADFLFLFVLRGEFQLRCEGREHARLAAGDSLIVPAAMPYALAECSPDLELLEVVLPAGFQTIRHET